MAARAIWRGQIRLALVSIPVELFPATRSGAQIQFHQVHEPTGKRIKYEKVVPGVGPVDRDEIVKGYEVSKGHYVLLDPEEIESVKLESRRTLDLVEFVDEDVPRVVALIVAIAQGAYAFAPAAFGVIRSFTLHADGATSGAAPHLFAAAALAQGLAIVAFAAGRRR